MNGITLGLVTFVIWISAKGELGKYIELTKTKDLDSAASSNSATTVKPLPELPPIGSGAGSGW